jgi:hypothetical protein
MKILNRSLKSGVFRQPLSNNFFIVITDSLNKRLIPFCMCCMTTYKVNRTTTTNGSGHSDANPFVYLIQTFVLRTI